MRKTFQILGSLALISVLAIPVYGFQFTNNMSIGDRGGEVLELQKILNSDSRTQVAAVGPGSPGNETTYFGSLTKNAVIRFQNIHAKEILEPLGLNFGTGYVGLSTRSKLNNQDTATESFQTVQTPQTSTTGLSANAFADELKDSKDLLLFFPSAYQGQVGTRLSLSGAGFESSNTVYFGERSVKNLPSQNGGTEISLTVPNIPNGMYYLSVENSKGKTDTEAFFVIKDPNTRDPVISSVSPNRVQYGDIVSIKASGLSSQNEIRTSYGLLKDISPGSDNTLSFKVEPYPDQMAGGRLDNIDPFDWEISVYVINENGVSNRASFTLEF